MKTFFARLKLFKDINMMYFFIINIILLFMLFFSGLKNEWVYLLLGVVLILFSLTICFLIYLIKQIPKSKEHLFRIILSISLLISCIILSYANLYHLIYELKGKGTFTGSSLRANDFLYYSVTTFTTTGYGDITSVGPISNMVAATEMLMGYTISTVIMGVIATKIYQKETSNK